MMKYRNNIHRWRKILAVVLLSMASHTVMAQKWNVKTNLLYDATTTFNIGAELKVAPQWSVSVSGNYNPFIFNDGKRWKHWMVQPEMRYWTKNAFKGHFVAAHVHGGQFNVAGIEPLWGIYPSLKDERCLGVMYGAGLGYGYRMNLNHRWGLEAQLGLGWTHSDYDRFQGTSTGDLLAKEKSDYWGLTQIGVSLVYTFGKSASRKKVESVVPVTATVLPQAKPEEPEVEVAPTREAETLQSEEPVTIVVALEEKDVQMAVEEISVLFEINGYTIRQNYSDNRRALQQLAGLLSLRSDEGWSADSIWISGYASPDGPESLNLALSEKRAQNLADHLRTLGTAAGSCYLQVSGMGEDWQGFCEKVRAAEDLPHRAEVIQIIDEYGKNRTLCEQKLKAMPEVYAYLKERLLPELRRNICRIVYQKE